jgi:GNAT superfamily N-acetyltransferase
MILEGYSLKLVNTSIESAMPVYEHATTSDIPALSALLSVLFTQEVEFQPDEAAQSKGLSAIINHPDIGAVLVARDGKKILAMVNLLFTVSTALGKRVAILEDMVVLPSARGTGVGSGLLSYAISFARRNEVKRITLLTDNENISAQRFYENHGFFKSSMMPLRLALD